MWKGTNATFVYSVLSSLLENWSRSLLSALFNVPDLGVKDDLDRLIDIASPYPWASLCVAATAAVVTGLILSPLDLVRTRYALCLSLPTLGFISTLPLCLVANTDHTASSSLLQLARHEGVSLRFANCRHSSVHHHSSCLQSFTRSYIQFSAFPRRWSCARGS